MAVSENRQAAVAATRTGPQLAFAQRRIARSWCGAVFFAFSPFGKPAIYLEQRRIDIANRSRITNATSGIHRAAVMMFVMIAVTRLRVYRDWLS
jgi:hypothetical protein